MVERRRATGLDMTPLLMRTARGRPGTRCDARRRVMSTLIDPLQEKLYQGFCRVIPERIHARWSAPGDQAEAGLA
ncbi:MAG: hypothetical protein ETSY1_05010 [Candidatus Entotheonella factor]|uniref:Uncharacterized protein n=1 Tax=Entotheonella factor TaxID=1429438 RepID=W4LXF3_ENTF1|nr:MAG: hypothetical protein ETSY1_05010 [Candidatus Entotheonella factor]